MHVECWASAPDNQISEQSSGCLENHMLTVIPVPPWREESNLWTDVDPSREAGRE
jgi:hypothetical protein